MPALPIDSDSAPVGLHSVLRGLVRREPLCVGPMDSVRDVLRAMDRRGGDVAVVADPDTNMPLGSVTLRDALRLIVEESCDLDQPVVGVMTGGLPALSADATVQQATLLMVRRGLRYLLLTEPDGRLFNIVAQSELYGLQAAGSEHVVASVLGAHTIEDLASAAAEVRGFAARRLAEGVGPEALCQWISALNDLVTIQVIDLIEGQFDLPIVPWCWLVFGSEGRLEQTLVTDQDNGIVFAADSAAEAEALRREFLPFAEKVNHALDACGFPLCRGQIMACNPSWCLSLDEWRQAFAKWIGAALPTALLNSTIFFDFRPIYGRDDLSGALRNWLLGYVKDFPTFLRAMAVSALETGPPLGMWGRFTFDDSREYPHTLDLKAQGIRLFVDAARVLALAHGVVHTNTVERLRAERIMLDMPLEETAAAVEAFYQIQRLRLRNQLNGEFPSAANRLNPNRLHELDRHILKEALRHARRLQQRVALDFQV